MIIKLANSNMYYVPTFQAFAEGEYESIQNRLVTGSGEKIVEKVLIMLNQINVN